MTEAPFPLPHLAAAPAHNELRYIANSVLSILHQGKRCGGTPKTYDADVDCDVVGLKGWAAPLCPSRGESQAIAG